MIEYLEWDSNFFGYRIGKYVHKDDANNIPENICFQNYDLVYIFSNIELNLFQYLMDIKITFEKTTELQSIDDKIVLFDSTLHSYEQLLELVYLSGHESRFLKDSFFGNIAFKKLYKTWIDKSLKNTKATTLVYLENNELLGFVSFAAQETVYNIELIAVTNKAHGLGLGTKLIHAVEHIVGANKKLTVPTQESNVGACNFYKNRGFKIKSKQYIYHYVGNPV